MGRNLHETALHDSVIHSTASACTFTNVGFVHSSRTKHGSPFSNKTHRSMRDTAQHFRRGVLRRHVRLRNQQPPLAPPPPVRAFPRQAPREVEARQLYGCVFVPGRQQQLLGAKVAVHDAHVVAVVDTEDQGAAQMSRVALAEARLRKKLKPAARGRGKNRRGEKRSATKLDRRAREKMEAPGTRKVNRGQRAYPERKLKEHTIEAG